MTKYSTSQNVLVGDKVELSSNEVCTVVADIGSGKYSADYKSEDWSYLKRGILVLSPSAGLIHMQEDVVRDELTFLERGH